MDNNSLADDVRSGARSYGPVFGNYFKRAGAVFTYFEVINVAGVEGAILSAVTVIVVHRIPVGPGRSCIRRAAISVLMQVDGVCSGCSALHLQDHLHAIAGFFKGCLSGEGTSTRALDLGRCRVLFRRA